MKMRNRTHTAPHLSLVAAPSRSPLQSPLQSLLPWLALGISAVCISVPANAVAASLRGVVTYKGSAAGFIVYVRSAAGHFAPPKRHEIIRQRHMIFRPHILPILRGTTVDFLNGDSVSHNVFSPDHEGYNLGTWPKGESRSYTFGRAGVYTQLCSLHPHMEAFVLVLTTPYWSRTAKNGSFSMTVPPGHYTLQVWSDRLKMKQRKQTFSVDVPAAGAHTVIHLLSGTPGKKTKGASS